MTQINPSTTGPANGPYAACIAACQACVLACEHCAASCLQEDDVKSMAGCIRLDLDCAQACQMAVAYMARDSHFAQALCRLCAEICEACGEECGRHAMDHCQQCAEACRRCAQACREMAGTAQGSQSSAAAAGKLAM